MEIRVGSLVELGKVWQVVLFAALVMWAVIIYRGVKPALRGQSAFSLPYWILYSVIAITILFLSSFVGGKNTNFVIADFLALVCHSHVGGVLL